MDLEWNSSGSRVQLNLFQEIVFRRAFCHINYCSVFTEDMANFSTATFSYALNTSYICSF